MAAHGNETVYASLIAYGRDRSGVLAAVIGLLRTNCTNLSLAAVDPAQTGFNVSHAWVRKVGEIGVVMLRFSTTEQSYRRILRYVDGLGMNPEDGQMCIADSDTDIGVNFRGLTIRVHRAERPFNLDRHIDSLVVEYSCAEVQWKANGSRFFEHILNNFSCDAYVDVAQMDIVITGDPPARVRSAGRPGFGASVSQSSTGTTDASRGSPEATDTPFGGEAPTKAVALLRLFDLGRRGPNYLVRQLQAAKESCGDLPLGVSCTHYSDDSFLNAATQRSGQTVEHTSNYIANALRGPEPLKDERQQFASLFVHALDVPGLFAEVTRLVTRDGHKIRRACCRGLGRDGVVLIEAQLAEPQSLPSEYEVNERDALGISVVLEARIRDGLSQFYRRAPNMGLIAEFEQGFVPPSGYWNLFVAPTQASPGAAGASRHTDVEGSVSPVPDRPGLLLQLVRMLQGQPNDREPRSLQEKLFGCLRRSAATSGRQFEERASIYYLDLRPVTGVVGVETPYSEIGVGLAITLLAHQRKEDVESEVERWWDGVYRQWVLGNDPQGKLGL